jgi:DNA repair protein RadC
LQTVDGLGETSALFLKFIREIALIYIEQSTLSSPCNEQNFLEQLAHLWLARLGGEALEHLEIAYLDGKFNFSKNGVERIETGGKNQVLLAPRKILEGALRRRCSAIVLCHNHPNCNVLPSEHDERLTKVVGSILQSISVRIVDHLIVSDGHVFSITLQREVRI